MSKKIIVIQTNLLIFLIFIFPSLVFAIDTSRPGPENIPTKVEIQLYVVDIAGINDGAQSFNASIFIEAKWKDQRLVSSNEKTTYNLNDVWNPDLQIINRGKLFLSYPLMYVVHHLDLFFQVNILYRNLLRTLKMTFLLIKARILLLLTPDIQLPHKRQYHFY